MTKHGQDREFIGRAWHPSLFAVDGWRWSVHHRQVNAPLALKRRRGKKLFLLLCNFYSGFIMNLQELHLANGEICCKYSAGWPSGKGSEELCWQPDVNGLWGTLPNLVFRLSICNLD